VYFKNRAKSSNDKVSTYTAQIPRGAKSVLILPRFFIGEAKSVLISLSFCLAEQNQYLHASTFCLAEQNQYLHHSLFVWASKISTYTPPLFVWRTKSVPTLLSFCLGDLSLNDYRLLFRFFGPSLNNDGFLFCRLYF
jgi:hypothetical protein